MIDFDSNISFIFSFYGTKGYNNLLGRVSAENANSFIMARMKIMTKGRWLWMRTIGSTIIGEGIDTVLFVAIAFAGILPWPLLFSVILSNYLFKCGFEVVVTPVTYKVVKYLKTKENEDYYDYTTDFNPFRLK